MQSNICLFLYLLKAQTHTYRGINCIVGQIYLALQMFHICFHFNDSPFRCRAKTRWEIQEETKMKLKEMKILVST
jgi:hypothetical protein